MADEQRRDRDDERHERAPSDDRAAQRGDDPSEQRAPDIPRRAPLTRREREERWPVG